MFEVDIKSYERRYQRAKEDAVRHLTEDDLSLALVTIATMIEHKAALEELRYQKRVHDGE